MKILTAAGNQAKRIRVNWIPGTAGIASLALGISSIINHFESGKEIDWNLTLIAIFSGVAHLFTRQSNKSSEQNKVEIPTP